MERQSNYLNTYKQVRVNTAHPGKIVVMLYDELLRQTDLAAQKLREGVRSLDGANTAILKAHDIVTELMVSLDMQNGEDIATQLYNLYDFFGNQLIQANVKKDSSIIEAIRPMIAELRESWSRISHTSMPDQHAAAKQHSAVDING